MVTSSSDFIKTLLKIVRNINNLTKQEIVVLITYIHWHELALKYTKVWLPRKFDNRTDTRTTHRGIDRCQIKWSLCAAMIRRLHKTCNHDVPKRFHASIWEDIKKYVNYQGSVTIGQTHIHTQTDKGPTKWSLCAAMLPKPDNTKRFFFRWLRKFFREEQQQSNLYLKSLSFSSHENQLSCPVTSLLQISLQSLIQIHLKVMEELQNRL